MIESVVLKITNKCNWSCNYCDNVDNKTSPIEKVKNYINLLQTYNPNILISLSGGEPGLLSKDYLQEIFNELNHPCEIATNGTFLENNYHEIFRSYINNISYHVISEINEPTKINVIKDNDIPIDYIIIVHKQNLKYIKSFIKTNDHINFTIKFYVGNDKDLILTISDIKLLYEIINLNIDSNSKDKIKHFSNILNKDLIKKSQRICNSSILVPRLDLIENKIYRCCAGNTNDIDSSPLHKLVLKILFTHNIFPCEKNNNICQACFHNFGLLINDIK